MEFKDRLKIAIENKGVTPYAIGRDTKVSKVSVLNYLNGTKPNIGNISILAEYLGVSVEWLISGENIQADKKQEDSQDNSNCTPHYEELAGKAIPHIDIVTASCGLPNGFSSAIMKDNCERYIIPDMPGCDFTIRAGGRSMINRSVPERSINDRDIVGCRIVRSRSHIRWGEVYALATYDGIMIKEIEQSDQEGYITCVPFNKDEGYKPYDIPINEVYDWALVVGVVSVKTWI
ncbi:LexA family transcriptional regulator [Bacteroides cellulosilyticus]|jgi:transcriptional regulator with XRE-family HTH domain|uniref:LexA family transcriptional regulator n=1 Tax=Bacteroides cellulosilyticus TaxID=246787 RepID=UPI00189E3A94|nr:LexA family transcriptional regulator [Bacteroides cellulosilyticus]DAU32319.1 MAG TPA: helix-turn-helix domain protein [Caudoviricetes sp.]